MYRFLGPRMSVKNKHDDACIRRRDRHPLLCTCGMADGEFPLSEAGFAAHLQDERAEAEMLEGLFYSERQLWLAGDEETRRVIARLARYRASLKEVTAEREQATSTARDQLRRKRLLHERYDALHRLVRSALPTIQYASERCDGEGASVLASDLHLLHEELYAATTFDEGGD